MAGLLFVVLSRYQWQHICDDAFIAFRFAENLIAGSGPVWNRGQPVEGYSSPLWLGVLAIGKAMGLPLGGWAGGAGVAFAGLCLLLVHRATLGLSDSRWAAAGATVATALVYPLYYWAPAGLETALFAALMTAAAWSLVGQSANRWAAVAACVGVARPEGPVLACSLVALAGVAHGRKALRPGSVALALSPMLLWFVFRRLYYGDWLPNTYYAKATGELSLRLTAGLIYASWALAALLVAAAGIWLAGIAHRKTLAAVAWVALEMLLVIVPGGDWMWNGRMLVPMLPALVVLAAAAIAGAPSRRRFVLVLACALVWPTTAPKPGLLVDAFAGNRMSPLQSQEGTLAQASFAAADFIAKRYPRSALVAVNHAGALPYALPNPALDMTGLVDWHIAHERFGSVHRKFDAAYVLSRKPDLVVLNSATRPGTRGIWYHPGYWEGETALVAQPEWATRYRPVEVFWEWHWVGGVTRYVLLFERTCE